MSRLGYVIVELEADTLTPASSKTAFDWDGGELFDTVEAARAEAVEATTIAGGGRFVYAVAELAIVESETC